MREPEILDGSQRACNVVEEMSWLKVASVGPGIPRGCLCQRMIDPTVRKRSWGRKEVVDTASASGHCLDCEEVNECCRRNRRENTITQKNICKKCEI